MKTQILRWCSLVTLAAVLSGCAGKKNTDAGEIVNQAINLPITTITKPYGEAFASGYAHRPSGSSVVYRVMPFNQLPEWDNQPFVGALNQFLQSCDKLYRQPQWEHVCQKAMRANKSHSAARLFFEQNFTVWQMADNGKLGGTVTGYYIPVLSGDVKSTRKARFPIYGIPHDMINVALPAHLRNSKATVRIRQEGANKGVIDANGTYGADLSAFPINERSSSLKGRFEGNQFVPYYTRAQINGGALNGKAPILAYADDPVELFFMHIQGSGHLKTPNGKIIHLGFADTNEHPFVGIARYMANKGYLPLAQGSMQGIKKWIAENPSKMAEVLGQNPRYVFFRELEGSSGSLGALGVPLAGELSGAVDRRFVTLGAPIFVATVHPDTRKGLNRLIMAQDTGAAIKGGVRVDFFWGYGDAAGQTAGKMKETGYVWQLLPHGVLPQYRP